MAEKLSPFVFWGQKSDSISLKVDLREIVVRIYRRNVKQYFSVRKHDCQLSIYVGNPNKKYEKCTRTLHRSR
jgi:hypothetical protein